MSSCFVAETDKLIRQPATWVLVGLWLVLNQLFSYLIPYASYVGGESNPVAGPPERVLQTTLPENLVFNSISGFPVFAGALSLTLGALAVGSEYNWRTLGTVLIQRPRRLVLYGGKLAALAAAVLALVLVTFALNALTSSMIALAESQTIAWPPAGELLRGFAAGLLIAGTWCLLGVLLAVLLRSTALPIGLGLVWALAVENLIRGVAAPLLESAETLQKGLPGVNAGSLVAALNGGAGDTPGVVSAVGGTQATLALVAYAVAFALIAGFVLCNRDVT